MASTITKTDLEAFEKVAIKFNLPSKWIDEGKEEGNKDGRQDVARTMLFEGCDVDFVAKMTKLTIDEVRGMKSEIENIVGT